MKRTTEYIMVVVRLYPTTKKKIPLLMMTLEFTLLFNDLNVPVYNASTLTTLLPDLYGWLGSLVPFTPYRHRNDGQEEKDRRFEELFKVSPEQLVMALTAQASASPTTMTVSTPNPYLASPPLRKVVDGTMPGGGETQTEL
ncbi:hypothetical protein ABW19_dt0204942 [Dactylella cylindrospora]|nr:hypothetical protein ABW19_dt0204942 [Dactylella cylindrospora]